MIFRNEELIKTEYESVLKLTKNFVENSNSDLNYYSLIKLIRKILYYQRRYQFLNEENAVDTLELLAKISMKNREANYFTYYSDIILNLIEGKIFNEKIVNNVKITRLFIEILENNIKDSLIYFRIDHESYIRLKHIVNILEKKNFKQKFPDKFENFK